MNKNGTCAVVITFRPQPFVINSLAKVRSQVEGLVVVDNGSSSELLEPFRALTEEMGFTLIENQANVGIAAGLNTGVRWAKARGYQYVALFDQDSTVNGDFMHAMLTEYASHGPSSKVAIVTPTQVERGTGHIRGPRRARDGTPLVAITSGSLMPVQIFEDCGWFEEQLIIDCVDHEYCLRARARGYTLAHCQEAMLLVKVGSTTRDQVFGLKVNATHHSAKRRYYITRNRLVMALRFWKQQPLWCCLAVMDIVNDTMKVVFVEQQRGTKLAYTARGIRDALIGRMGKVVEL